MKKYIIFMFMTWTLICFSIVKAKADVPMIVVINQTTEQLTKQLGYCNGCKPPQVQHGIYYVLANGKCMAKVK